MKTYNIETLELGPMANLVYLVTDVATKQTAVVDPAWEPEKIISLCEQKGIKIDQIWLTHAHNDHVNGLEAILDKYDASLHMLKAEVNYWDGIIKNPILHYGGDILKLGESKIEILHTPGHSKGSACYHLGQQILTGDTLFVFGCGHCKLEGAEPEVLYKTLKKMKTELADKLEILPGHFYAEHATATMESQKEGNPFLLCETEQEFLDYRGHIHDKTRVEPYQTMTRLQVMDLLKS